MTWPTFILYPVGMAKFVLPKGNQVLLFVPLPKGGRIEDMVRSRPLSFVKAFRKPNDRRQKPHHESIRSLSYPTALTPSQSYGVLGTKLFLNG